MKKRYFLINGIFLLAGVLLFSSWGSVGHKKINQHAPASFPIGMGFLKASWTILLANHASDADYRKSSDPNEAPKHYIDIDDYPEFRQSGKIAMSWDSIISLHGNSFVIDKGILPWATLITFDSVKSCFLRKDWNKAGLFAADLGHYVADGHMPLHITANYNGQNSNQTGVHSRYESTMIGDYQTQINYQDDSVSFLPNVQSSVFTYLYHNYIYVDSVLIADKKADSIAGGTSGSTYYSNLWGYTGSFTTALFKHASYALAGLVYTAWVEAGRPNMNPSAMEEFTNGDRSHLKISPNPFSNSTTIKFEVTGINIQVNLSVLDSSGKTTHILLQQDMNQGEYSINWDPKDLPTGSYFIVLSENGRKYTQKAILMK